MRLGSSPSFIQFSPSRKRIPSLSFVSIFVQPLDKEEKKKWKEGKKVLRVVWQFMLSFPTLLPSLLKFNFGNCNSFPLTLFSSLSLSSDECIFRADRFSNRMWWDTEEEKEAQVEIKMREKMERVGMEERVTFTELISLTRMDRDEKTFHSMINTWKERIDLRILHSDPLLLHSSKYWQISKDSVLIKFPDFEVKS